MKLRPSLPSPQMLMEWCTPSKCPHFTSAVSQMGVWCVCPNPSVNCSHTTCPRASWRSFAAGASGSSMSASSLEASTAARPLGKGGRISCPESQKVPKKKFWLQVFIVPALHSQTQTKGHGSNSMSQPLLITYNVPGAFVRVGETVMVSAFITVLFLFLCPSLSFPQNWLSRLPCCKTHVPREIDK